MQADSLRRPQVAIKVDQPTPAAPAATSPATTSPANPTNPENPASPATPADNAGIGAPQAPIGRLRRTSGVSIKNTSTVNTADLLNTQTVVGPPLNDESMHQVWNEMVEQMKKSDKKEFQKLASQLEGRELQLEGEDMIVIIVNNSFLESQIKPFLIQMLSFLRKKAQRPDLNSRIQVVYLEKEAKAYSPRDKYDVMVNTNPALEHFRVLFPEVDY